MISVGLERAGSPRSPLGIISIQQLIRRLLSAESNSLQESRRTDANLSIPLFSLKDPSKSLNHMTCLIENAPTPNPTSVSRPNKRISRTQHQIMEIDLLCSSSDLSIPRDTQRQHQTRQPPSPNTYPQKWPEVFLSAMLM